MPDWKITLSRTVAVNGQPKVLQADHDVEGMERTLAILSGIKHLLYTATELVPDDARKYWESASRGALQPYEVQSELENNWGLTFGIAQVGGGAEVVDTSPSHPAARNGLRKVSGDNVRYDDSIPDLNSMLSTHLKMLQTRSLVLSDQLQRAQAEYDRINHDIMRISAMVGPPTVAEMLVDPPFLPPPENAAIVVEMTHQRIAKHRGRSPKRKEGPNVSR